MLRDAMASQEVSGGICAVDLETLVRAAVLMRQAHVMEHRARIKQFGIESEFPTFAGQRSPVKDAARMVKQQRRLGIVHQLHYLAGELAVGNPDARQTVVLGEVDIHSMSPAGLSERRLPIT
jgi:hypothetical protein